MRKTVKKTTCPICTHLIDFCEDDTEIDVQCPYCLSFLRIWKDGYVKELGDYLLPEINIALHKSRRVAIFSVYFAVLPVVLGLISWCVGSELKHMAWAIFCPPLLSAIVFLGSYPWAIPLGRGLRLAKEFRRQQEIQEQRQRAEQLLEAKKAELSRLTALRLKEQIKQTAREQALRSELQRLEEKRRLEEQERLLLLTDAGYEECWRKMNWWDFEIAVLLFFEHLGCKIEKATPPMKDGGIDGVVVDSKGTRWAIQCKHYREDQWVQAKEIRDFIGALDLAKIKNGYFISTGPYGASAENTAKNASSASIHTRGIKDLMEKGHGLKLNKEIINQAKVRLGVPVNPPSAMSGNRRVSRRYNKNRW